MEAETQRQLSEKEHQKSAAIFEAAKQKVLKIAFSLFMWPYQ